MKDFDFDSLFPPEFFAEDAPLPTPAIVALLEQEPKPEPTIVELEPTIVEPEPEPPIELPIVEPEPPIVEPEPPTIQAPATIQDAEIVEVNVPRSGWIEPDREVVSSTLPRDLLDAIRQMAQGDTDQMEFENEDGFAFGDLDQLEASATAYDDIAYRHDLIEWGEIFIGQGTTKMRLPWEGMGFSEAAIEALKKADATQTAITLFDTVRKAANELKGMRSRLYERRFTRYGNKWVSVASGYGAVCIELSAMLDREVELRRQINDGFAGAKQGCLVAIAEIVQATTTLSHAEIDRTIREEYLPRFPSQTQMNRSFRLRIEKPRIRPALKRQLEGQLESAELLAQITHANRTIEEEEAIRRVTRMNEQVIMEAKAKAVNSFSQKVLRKIAETLGRLSSDKVRPGNLTKTVQESVTRALEDLRVMTDQPWATTSLQEAVNQLQSVGAMAQDGEVSREELTGRIDTLLSEFDRTYDFNFTPASIGHRTFATIELADED